MTEQPTLEEIENDRWGDAPDGSTRLVETAHALRRKPLDEFTAEDLRLLIGQQIGVDTLVPMAIRVLEEDPLAEGDLYPGDLLFAVLRKVPSSYWAEHPRYQARFDTVVDAAITAANDPDDDRLEPDDDELREAVAAYRLL